MAYIPFYKKRRSGGRVTKAPKVVRVRSYTRHKPKKK